MNSRAHLRFAVTALLLSSAAAFSAAASHAATPRGSTNDLINATDTARDVKVIERPKGLPVRQLKASDLLSVKAKRMGNSVRFIFGIRDVLPTQKFDQMMFVNFTPPADSTATWSSDIGVSPQLRTLGYASYVSSNDDDATYRTCDPIAATVLWGKEAVRLDVPLRCLPDEPARMKVTTMTGYFRSDAGIWTKDVLRVPGRFDVGSVGVDTR